MSKRAKTKKRIYRRSRKGAHVHGPLLLLSTLGGSELHWCRSCGAVFRLHLPTKQRRGVFKL